MKKLHLGSYQEQYEINKQQIIKDKKGRIVSLELLEELKKEEVVINIDVSITFDPKISLQKIVFNQGFLLPYKFSKEVEKAKFILFLLKDNEGISKKDFKIALFHLNQVINEQINTILQKHTKQDWEVSEMKMSKLKK